MGRFSFEDAQRLLVAVTVAMGCIASFVGRELVEAAFGKRTEITADFAPLWFAALFGLTVWGTWRYGVAPLRRLLAMAGWQRAWDVIAAIGGIALPYALLVGFLLSVARYVASPVASIAIFALLLFGQDWMQTRSRDALRAAAGFSL